MVLGMDTQTRRQRSCDVQRPEQRRRGLKSTHSSILAWHILVLVYYCYSKLLGCCDAHPTSGGVRLVDLSHTFDDTTIYWVTAKRLNLTVIHNGTDPDGKYWFQVEEMSAGTHGGTHLDAPCHFARGRWCVSDIPLRHLVTSAVVVDISNEVGDNPNVHLTADHLEEWEQAHGRIPDGSVLLVRTGWSRFWPDPLTYSGTTERNASLLKFPSIEPGAARWLIANRNVVGVGIDSMSVDIPATGRMPETHVTLYDKNIYGLENVNMPEPLPPTGVKVIAMPMKLRAASGAPCRILAEVPVTYGNVGSSISFPQPWTSLSQIWHGHGSPFLNVKEQTIFKIQK